MTIERILNAGFTSLILLVLIASVITATAFPWYARIFPLAMGIPAVLIVAIQLARDVLMTGIASNSKDDTGHMDLFPDRDIPGQVVAKRAAGIFAWIFGLLVVIKVIGIMISVPLFILLYVKLSSHEGWRVTLVGVGFILGLEIGVFHFIMHLPWGVPMLPQPQEVLLDLLDAL